eukprot:snap_masked-scaffold801_size95070-processed-gene-0.12 protein:Tk01653 transcript:snap_masked-scaffold801_size95070-processed-gene-0.12-mRNA-1 annotation:"hypothetical protein DAPPUDRAFT_206200"
MPCMTFLEAPHTMGSRWDRLGHVMLQSFIEYETPRLVKVHNVYLGLVIRVSQILVFSYVISYAILYERGYQEFGQVESSVTVKLKGTSRSHIPTHDNVTTVPSDWRHLYNRIWDVADYVVPPAENGAFFITTNVVLTPNQTQGACPEDPAIKRATCSNDSDCTKDHYLVFAHGPMTGRCVPSDRRSGTKVCEVQAWCPIEKDGLPFGMERPMMDNVNKYTVFIKNSIAFPFFGSKYRKNNVIPGPRPSIYHPTKQPLGQIFWMGDMIDLAGGNFTQLSLKGGVVSISIQWNCDLDYSFDKYCLPHYEFRVLDTGWNFRHALFHENGRRTLIKAYGLRFVIIVDGLAGKFSLRNTILNVGNGLALLGITTFVGEFFLLYFAKEKKNVVARKYDYISKRRNAIKLPVLLEDGRANVNQTDEVFAPTPEIHYQ